MILKKIKIMNYRQLQSVELDMQESLTVLAGPNNSGKTTLISVLKGMFCDKKLGFSYSDIPISLSSMWLEKTVPVKMKTLIITDLDYDKKNLSMEEVKAKDSKSTNATINYCYRVAYPDRGEKYVPTIKELYDFQVEGKNILYNGLVYLAFQDENSTARTLEEAMLKKILKVDVFHMIKRSEWKKIRKDKKLTFSIPDNKEGEKDSKYSIRKIVEATSNNKTDFMYSVILSENEEKMLPDYIKKGLLWLMK